MRAFICIVPDQQAKRKIGGLQRQLLSYGKGRIVSAENLHITLAFLGEVNEADLPRIQHAMSFPFEQMVITFSEIGVFHRKKDLWWLGIEENEELNQAQRILVQRLKEGGFDLAGTSFRGHVTLIRNARIEWPGQKEIAFEPFSMKAERMILMKSELFEQKRIYTEIKL
ncbi:MAG: RNA 2',3'-cyclic phosphodiesterase [Erysipelotrichaceae bacterium]|nr:RNA 2',3'-cyclic phosphodiesterase [Erysipelotrichaceae bacterium]